MTADMLVEVELVYGPRGANLFHIAKCPYCGCRHTHGAGRAGDDPHKFAGHRIAHCDHPGGYALVWLGKVARNTRENLRDRKDPGISGDEHLNRYGDVAVGRYARSSTLINSPAAVPDWIKLLTGGKIETRDARGPYTMIDAEKVIAASRALEMEAGLPIDFNHSTDLAAERGGSSPAAGWIVDLQARGGDVWGKVRWTKKGLAAVSRGPHGEPAAYAYVSPVFSHSPTGEILQLLRAGLTNWPNLYRSAICARNGRENTHSLTSVELAICRNLNIRRDVFTARKEMSKWSQD